MLALFRPFVFARRVRQTILAVPGVRAVKVYPEVKVRPMVQVYGEPGDDLFGWKCRVVNALYGAMDGLGGLVDHGFEIVRDTQDAKEDE